MKQILTWNSFRRSTNRILVLIVETVVNKACFRFWWLRRRLNFLHHRQRRLRLQRSRQITVEIHRLPRRYRWRILILASVVAQHRTLARRHVDEWNLADAGNWRGSRQRGRRTARRRRVRNWRWLRNLSVDLRLDRRARVLLRDWRPPTQLRWRMRTVNLFATRECEAVTQLLERRLFEIEFALLKKINENICKHDGRGWVWEEEMNWW